MYSKELKQIYHNLRNGVVYGEYLPHRLGGTFFWDVLKFGYGYANKPYWFWSHFGSSANDATMKELAWILQVIFRMTPKDFIEKYQTQKTNGINNH